MKYVNTLVPSTTVALISGFHKVKGDTVVLLRPNLLHEPQDFDKAYIVNDTRHDYQILDTWKQYPRVELFGRFYERKGLIHPNEEWEKYPPDFEIYHPFIDYWRNRYPSYNLTRLEKFFMVPFKMKRGGDIFYPSFDSPVIIDYDIDKWDPDFIHLSSIEVKNIQFNNPLPVGHNMEGAIELFKLMTIARKHFWAEIEMDLNRPDEDYIQMAKECAEIGRMFRIKAWAEAENDEEWQKMLIKVYKMLAAFRMLATKRVYFEPINYKSGKTNFPLIIQFAKRWCGKSGFTKNSLWDYVLYDGLQTIDKITSFLMKPEECSKTNPKARALYEFTKNYPELTYAISQSFIKGGW